MITPNSYGASLREANDCHTPAGRPDGGQFCAKSGASREVTLTKVAAAVGNFGGRNSGFQRRSATYAVQVGDRVVAHLGGKDGEWRLLDPQTGVPVSKNYASKALALDHARRMATPEAPASREVTRVGITTARKPEDTVYYRPNAVVAEQMRALASGLKRLPGVRAVEVKPAQGQWKDGSEFSFAVAYIGNGQARRMLAELGKTWNQDSVLYLRRPKRGETPDAAYEFVFERAVSRTERNRLAALMGEGGMGFGGWTWYKRNGKTTLRLVCVPQWGGENKAHRQASMRLGSVLSRSGHGFRVRELHVKAEVMDHDNYDRIMKGGAL